MLTTAFQVQLIDAPVLEIVCECDDAHFFDQMQFARSVDEMKRSYQNTTHLPLNAFQPDFLPASRESRTRWRHLPEKVENCPERTGMPVEEIFVVGERVVITEFHNGLVSVALAQSTKSRMRQAFQGPPENLNEADGRQRSQ